MRIALTGGGTGGHFFPIIAVAREIRRIVGEKEECDFLFLGPSTEMERDALAKEDIEQKPIISGKMRRYFSGLNFLDIFKLPVGLVQALWHLLAFMPDAVFAKGGYASVPVVIAARIYRIPVLIHESDVMPGLANQILSKFAQRIALSFSGSESFFPDRKIFLAGNPIRSEFAIADVPAAQRFFSLEPEKKVVLVMGGSQGAKAINEAITHLLPRILPKWELIHLTGKNGYEEVVSEAGKLGFKAGRGGYHPFPFLSDEMALALAAADVVVSRAGANSLSEIAANAKPAIIIPIDSSANNHQEQNAFVFSQAGAAIVLEQNNLGENILFAKIQEILEDKELSFELSERIKKFYNPQAPELIATEIIQLAR